jgi:hypothetical protein
MYQYRAKPANCAASLIAPLSARLARHLGGSAVAAVVHPLLGGSSARLRGFRRERRRNDKQRQSQLKNRLHFFLPDSRSAILIAVTLQFVTLQSIA